MPQLPLLFSHAHTDCILKTAQYRLKILSLTGMCLTMADAGVAGPSRKPQLDIVGPSVPPSLHPTWRPCPIHLKRLDAQCHTPPSALPFSNKFLTTASPAEVKVTPQGLQELANATRTFISSSAVGINALEFGPGKTLEQNSGLWGESLRMSRAEITPGSQSL